MPVVLIDYHDAILHCIKYTNVEKAYCWTDLLRSYMYWYDDISLASCSTRSDKQKSVNYCVSEGLIGFSLGHHLNGSDIKWKCVI